MQPDCQHGPQAVSLLAGMGDAKGLFLILATRSATSGDILPSYFFSSLSCMTEAIIEPPMAPSITTQTTLAGTWYILPIMSLTPMNTRTIATPYFSKENKCTNTSMMKNVARRPSIAKTAQVYARKRSGTCATIALTESTANKISLISKHDTTRNSIVARVS